MAIERRSLRSQVREELLARMRNGVVQPGERINEVQLASELGVSRTPLREALIALESEGQIESESGKGFRFVPLSAREFEELAPIMANLESLALSLTDPAELPAIGARLTQLAADFDQEVAVHALVASKDDEWHAVMLSGCPNGRLLHLIAGMRQAYHRYESLLVADEVMISRVAAEHSLIASHLVDGDVAAASVALHANWMNGMRRLLATASSQYLTA
ncbi:GntR family transcriptional regulator [Microterricola viridarii]|uniref:DNA-binding transcriptional regulator, GntR family n=1 Tax=Microterricola viridarii TaxID=412690 RepID=A0A1H1Z318_9MICO|nr:GntR family transcriptional regulator [Microterricola viridarii]SDT28144.1 DNA-binding transcriptional regulator, GntR family [Microterricola viridarii]